MKWKQQRDNDDANDYAMYQKDLKKKQIVDDRNHSLSVNHRKIRNIENSRLNLNIWKVRKENEFMRD